MGLSPMDYWRLASSLSVVNCAILITGNDPSEEYQDPDTNDWVQVTNYKGFTAALEALKDAILTNQLSAAVAFPLTDAETSDREGGWGRKLTAILRGGSKIFELRGLRYYPKDSLVFLQKEPDWQKTMIEVRDLKAWLQSKGVFPDFFFPQGDPDSYMNRDHPRYSAKLACAISAWREIKHPAKNKTPKQTIEAWVQANGVNYGLQNEDGVVPKAAVEEIAKVVNWQTQGGVARTGGVVQEAPDVDPPSEPKNYEEVTVSEDGGNISLDDVPF
jgi:hypothetical protein